MMNIFDWFNTGTPPLITQAMEDIRVMLDTAHAMAEAAARQLLEGEPSGIDLETQDTILDEKQQAIRRAVLEHLSINPTQELVFSLTLISIVQDVERLGDLARGLSEIATLERQPLDEKHGVAVRDLVDEVLDLFDQVRDAFLESDVEQATAAMEQGLTIKDNAHVFFRALATEAALAGNEALVLGGAAQSIGRLAAHLSTITSSVVLPFDRMGEADE